MRRARMRATIPRRPNRRRRRGGRLRGNAPSDVGLSSGGDVEIDNEPAALCHQSPQEAKRIDARVVAALERDLQRVLPDERHIAYAQLILVEASHTREPAWRARLAPALRARARPPQLIARVSRARAALPDDVHHVARAIDVDVGWKRVWVLRRSS